MKSSASIFLRKDYQKTDGTNPIYLRIIISGKKKDYSLGVSVLEKHLNAKKYEIKAAHEDSFRFNLLIQKELKKAKDIFFNYAIRDKYLSIPDFDKHYKNDSYNSKSFYNYIEKQIRLHIGKFSEGTIHTYKTQLSKLQKYKPRLEFGHIDVDFIKEYDSYMSCTLENNESTRTKSLKFISQIINKAMVDGIVEENPFKKANIRFKRINSNREYLTLKELEVLEKLLAKSNLTKSKTNVLEYFLFSCYTGLRYSDVKQLRYKNIIDGNISIVTKKTQKKVEIPLIPQAKRFVGKGLPEQKVFRVISDQPTNRYLKVICEDAGIKKHISFHCSRHTFATNCLELGISIEVLKELLGHSELRETLLYAKTTNKKKAEAMRKWI
jgi:integrase